jgi:hypothetical protein
MLTATMMTWITGITGCEDTSCPQPLSRLGTRFNQPSIDCASARTL